MSSNCPAEWSPGTHRKLDSTAVSFDSIAEERSMGPDLFLVCQSHNLSCSRFALSGDKLIIGRSSDCAIYVAEPTVSRMHAEIGVLDVGIWISDLGSKNGTLVQGKRIESKPTPIQLHDEVQFGSVVFRLADSLDNANGFDSGLSTFGVAIERRTNATESTLAGLTKAQRRVFDLLLHGLSERDVAGRLNVSPHTIHNHTREIYRIVGVHSRPELLTRFLPSS